MTLHDDRTFVRHFSWVILGLVGVTIVFIILSFAIVGASGINNKSGYTYTQYVEAHAAMNRARAAASAQPAALGGSAPGAVGAVAGATAGGSAAAVAAGGAASDGKAIWTAHCAACHATGAGGAPKIGDKSAWGPILAETDLATLYSHAIHGYQGKLGFMPPKGGATNLTDAQVEAAVKYMVDQSQ